MPKPYAVHIDRGFYGCGVFIPPIHLVFETEKAAREGYQKEIEAQKAEIARTEGKPICLCKLIYSKPGGGQDVLLNQIVEKEPNGAPVVIVREGGNGSIC